MLSDGERERMAWWEKEYALRGQPVAVHDENDAALFDGEAKPALCWGGTREDACVLSSVNCLRCAATSL
jgi:hypothetical protein